MSDAQITAPEPRTPKVDCTTNYCPVRTMCVHWRKAHEGEPHRFMSWEQDGCEWFVESEGGEG